MQSSRRVAQVAEVAEVVEVARVTKSCTKSICGQNDMAVTVATIVARQTPIKGALPLTFQNVEKAQQTNQVCYDCPEESFEHWRKLSQKDAILLVQPRRKNINILCPKFIHAFISMSNYYVELTGGYILPRTSGIFYPIWQC